MSGEGFTDALPPGTKLLWFDVIKVLGKGGFGITYLGKDNNQGQRVAIKEYFPTAYASRGSHLEVTPNSPADAKTFDWGLDRFLKEAQILAQFQHPCIVRVISFFRSGNTAYMVMEYVEGEGLDSLLRRSKVLDEASLKKLLPLLLDGLEVLHRADYIHRDIKPPNIFIRKQNGMPVILDFGSARQSMAGRGGQMTSLLSMGYSPFEQYDSTGNRQGPWSDIYALGGVLYRAVTGHKPMEASIRVAARLRNAPDPLPSAEQMGKDQYSPEFLRAIDRALMVMEKDRPQSVREWRPLLLGAQEETTVTTTFMAQQGEDTGTLQTAGNKTNWRNFISSLNAFSSRLPAQEGLISALPDLVAPKPGDMQRITPQEVRSAPAAATTTGELAAASATNATGLSGGVSDTRTTVKRGSRTVLGKEDSERIATLLRDDFKPFVPEPPPPVETAPPQRLPGTLWEEPATKMAFVWVPGGVFAMGASLADASRKEDEGPEHEVELDGFWIAKYPVTWGLWRRIMGDYPPGLYMHSRVNHPVERISWLDVHKFIDKMGRMIGSRDIFRLPTEAEWEYAARAGAYALPLLEKSSWQFGTEKLADHAWFRGNARGQSHPVGEMKANPWGIHDMLGNVWEWVSDRYQADYYEMSPRLNPQGPPAPAPGSEQPGKSPSPVSRFARVPPPREMRVARGGGFNSIPQECWPTSRLRMAESASAVTVGFRLVRQD
ncbi:MAG: SUMF1/EgtB/PvdO family nonheme iron enzyme [Magnetococcales bacterium]|nr:SUMF1/EgtB/PvdO family nonheme iron enzyme [Magnetococcales bacterium]